jgi:hypothetical protein
MTGRVIDLDFWQFEDGTGRNRRRAAGGLFRFLVGVGWDLGFWPLFASSRRLELGFFPLFIVWGDLSSWFCSFWKQKKTRM